MSERTAGTALDPAFEEVLRSCLDGQLPADVAIDETSDLTVLRLDSLSVVRLLVTIEDVFGVMIPDEMITFEIFSSPGALWDVVRGLKEQTG